MAGYLLEVTPIHKAVGAKKITVGVMLGARAYTLHPKRFCWLNHVERQTKAAATLIKLQRRLNIIDLKLNAFRHKVFVFTITYYTTENNH